MNVDELEKSTLLTIWAHVSIVGSFVSKIQTKFVSGFVSWKFAIAWFESNESNNNPNSYNRSECRWRRHAWWIFFGMLSFHKFSIDKTKTVNPARIDNQTHWWQIRKDETASWKLVVANSCLRRRWEGTRSKPATGELQWILIFCGQSSLRLLSSRSTMLRLMMALLMPSHSRNGSQSANHPLQLQLL